MAKPKTKAVQIDAGLHLALVQLVSEETTKMQRRVTLRDVVEEAVVSRWPKLAACVRVVIDVAVDAETSAGYLRDIMREAFSDVGWPGEPSPLQGYIAGSFGQPIGLQQLVAYFRNNMPSVVTLTELIRHYERAEAAAKSVEKMLT